MGKVSRMRALVFASGVTVLLFGSSAPLSACDSQNCDSRLVVAQAQTTPATQTTQPVASGRPVSLKKFTRAKSRSARSARKSALAQRTQAARKAKEAAARENAKAAATTKVTQAIANANAELLEGVDPAKASDVRNASKEQAPAADAAAAEATQVVAADEFNDIDKAAWDVAQVKPTNAALMDSRAEMREDESKWAQTSTIGKMFVVFGALLTIGSAVRMFLA